MTKLQAIRDFTTTVLGEHVTIARDKCDCGNWAMDIDNKTPRLKLPKDLDYEADMADKAFRKDFVERCNCAKGFSHVTLTILHECGHWATRSVFDVVEYEKLAAQAYTQTLYMAIPWESLATQWAICWLLCPANRKIAKAFERSFFDYGKN